MIVDDIDLTEDTDFTALALGVLRGGIGGSLRSDNYPLDWLLRVYPGLTGTPWADPLSLGVAACLTVDEPFVRVQALMFFEFHPRAAGAERIVELAQGDRALFAGVASPLGGPDLEQKLLDALAARVEIGDAVAIGLACALALRPGKGSPLAGALSDQVPDWVYEHAEEIVRGSPTAGATILIRLHADGDALADLARRIAPLCHDDPRFELDIPRFVEDPRLRRIILDAFHGG